MQTLQQIFNRIVMDGETLRIADLDAKSYDSLRVMLVRKFLAYKNQCSDMGIESYDDKFLKCIFDKQENCGVFRLCNTTEHRRKVFEVSSL